MNLSHLELLICPKCKQMNLKQNQDLLECTHCKSTYNFYENIIDMRDSDNDKTMNFSFQKDLLIGKILLEKINTVKYFNGLIEIYEQLSRKEIHEINEIYETKNFEFHDLNDDTPLRADQSIHGFDVLKKIDLYRNDFKMSDYNTNCCLENGCGHGFFIEGFSEKFEKVIVLDFSLAYLALAKKICLEKNLKNIFLVCGNSENLPIKEEKIDFIHSNNVIEHVDNQKKMISEINRVLKKNGFLFLLSPNKNSAYFEPHFLLPFYGYIPLFIRSWLVRKMHNRDSNEVKLLNFNELKKIFKLGFIGKNYFTFIPSKLNYTAQNSISRKIVVNLLNNKIFGYFTNILLNKIFINIMPYHVIIAQKNKIKNN